MSAAVTLVMSLIWHTSSLATAREVMRDALLRESCALVLVHNHPSGATDSSRADEYLTQMLKQAAALVDVRVLDHFIVAGDSVSSMAELGLV